MVAGKFIIIVVADKFIIIGVAGNLFDFDITIKWLAKHIIIIIAEARNFIIFIIKPFILLPK